MKHFYENLTGWAWFLSAYEKLLALMPKDRPTQWVELGIYHGRSLAWLGVEVVNSGKPISIHGIDVAPAPTIVSNLEPLIEKLGDRLRLTIGDSAASADLYPDDSVDVVWVDADHSYEGCTRDIEAWWPKLKAGGYMGGDDLEMAGVEQAVRARFGTEYEVGEGTLTDCDPPRPYRWWLVRKP